MGTAFENPNKIHYIHLYGGEKIWVPYEDAMRIMKIVSEGKNRFIQVDGKLININEIRAILDLSDDPEINN